MSYRDKDIDSIIEDLVNRIDAIEKLIEENNKEIEANPIPCTWVLWDKNKWTVHSFSYGLNTCPACGKDRTKKHFWSSISPEEHYSGECLRVDNSESKKIERTAIMRRVCKHCKFEWLTEIAEKNFQK